MIQYSTRFYLIALFVLLYIISPAQLFTPFVKTLKDTASFHLIPPYDEAKPPLTITGEQALQDISMLEYIINNAFAGRDYWQSNGLDFPSMYKSLRKLVTGNTTVATGNIEDTIYHYLSLINDAHTHVTGFKNREMVRNLRPYYSEIVVEKRGNTYIVVNSADARVKKGARYLGPVSGLFRTLSAPGITQYLVGQQSVVPIEKMKVSFNSGSTVLTLHPSKMGDIRFADAESLYEMDTAAAIPVIRSSSFSHSQNQKSLTDFINSGKLLSQKKAFIWNIIDNRGGDGYFPTAFIQAFNGTSYENVTTLTLYSPVINQCYWPGRNSWIHWDALSMKGLKDELFPLDSIPAGKREKIRRMRQDKKTVQNHPEKLWEVEPAKAAVKGTYEGKVIVLVNHLTNSAANNAVAMAKNLKNALIVGENTGSAYTFANVKYYALEHSRIKLWLPSVLLLNPDNRMEKGFEPDYWLDTADPVSEVRRWLASPSSYQFSYTGPN